MAENTLNNPPCKKKKTNTADMSVDGNHPVQSFSCDVTLTHPTTTAFTDNVTQDPDQSLTGKRRRTKDDVESSIDTSIDTEENPTTSSGLKNTLHGNVFQLKLLMLFLIRGIASEYQFHLGTEIPGMGGKFDDLIFKWNLVKDGETVRDKRSERFRYLQAKHKQNENSDIS